MSLPTANRPATVDETLACIRGRAEPLAGECVPLAAALDRVLREAVTAPEDQPACDVSAVDGYAVRLDDLSNEFQVIGLRRAGDWQPLELSPGQALQIATGAALPGAGLQVVMKEDAQRDGDRVRFRARDAETRIRYRGENARAGAVLVPAGTRLTHGALALLASVGCACPQVTRLPRVLHIATGNELVAPEETPRAGQIRDSNTTLVGAFLRARGVTPEQHRLPEEETPACALLADRLAGQSPPDVVLISGGASVGEHDFTRRLLERFGFELLVHRTTTRPGKPLIFAARGHTLAFGLPGNPLAHFVCLNLYVRAAIEGFSGSTVVGDFMPGRLAVDFAAAASDRESLWPARLDWAGGCAALTPLPWQSSGDLSPLAAANALARIPPATEILARGAPVQYIGTEIMA